MVQAKRALEVIAAISSRENLTEADINIELSAIDPEKINQLQLIGVVIEDTSGPRIRYSGFSFRAPYSHAPKLGRVCGGGSGSGAFFELLQKSDWLAQTDASPYQVAHGLLGALINEEYRTGKTIGNRWGGGFEAVTFLTDSGRLEKIGDILHTFWSVREREHETLWLLPFFYKTAYWQDVLILRSATVENARGDILKLKSDDMTLVAPTLKDIGDYNTSELEQIDFSYRAVCCHVFIEKSSGYDLELVIDQRKGGARIAISFRSIRRALAVVRLLAELDQRAVEYGRRNITSFALGSAVTFKPLRELGRTGSRAAAYRTFGGFNSLTVVDLLVSKLKNYDEAPFV